jgi:hypothetical protein
VVGDDVDHRLSADCGDPRRDDRGDGVVHGLQHEPVQVEKITGYQNRQDLPPSVGHQAVPARHPPGDDKGRARHFALDHDVRTGIEAFFRKTQRLEQADICAIAPRIARAWSRVDFGARRSLPEMLRPDRCFNRDRCLPCFLAVGTLKAPGRRLRQLQDLTPASGAILGLLRGAQFQMAMRRSRMAMATA